MKKGILATIALVGVGLVGFFVLALAAFYTVIELEDYYGGRDY